MRAYHFLREDMRSGKGYEPPWAKGETRTREGKCELCLHGYHSSPSWLDALKYAPGPIACIVDVSKPVEKDDDKQVSKTRTLVDYRDATRTLHQFACDCAEYALKVEGVKDERAWNAITTKRLWLDGKATDEELDTAGWAIWDASAGADGAVYLAMRAAARAAANDNDAAYVAKGVVERTTIRIDEEAWQRQRLDEMMEELFKEGE